MPTQDEFLLHLSKALYHLYDPHFLGSSVLVDWFGLGNRPDTFSSLQKILLDAIEAQSSMESASSSTEWQVYEPLFYRFTQQLAQDEVARNLNMSVRHFRRKEHGAIKVLGAYLWSKYAPADFAASNASPAAGEKEAGTSILEELAWLRTAPLERPVRLEQVFGDLRGVISSIAGRYEVELALPETFPSDELPVHEAPLKQALLNLLNMAILLVMGGQVTVSIHPLGSDMEIRIVRSGLAPGSGQQSYRREEVESLTRDLIALCGGQLHLEETETSLQVSIFLPVVGQIPVLVVDDNVDALQLLQRYATGTRYRVWVTRDPAQVIALVEQIKPRILFLDVMMPGIDGWQLLMQLRQHALARNLPIVICTILPQREIAEALSASGFLQKPVMRQDFLDVLNQQIALMETTPR